MSKIYILTAVFISHADTEAQRARETEAFREKFTAFLSKENTNCPHCGRQVEALKRRRNHFYGEPCGCLIARGTKFPAAWR